MDKEFKVFLVLEVLKGNLKRPEITFIEKDYGGAKLYFKAYMEAVKHANTRDGKITNLYQLYCIGIISQQNVFKPSMIYITDSYNIFAYNNDVEVSQLSINLAGKKMATEKMWLQNRNFSDKIKGLFNGKFIE